MSSRAQMTVTITASRGGSTVRFSTRGRYISFFTRGFSRILPDQPIQPTADLATFWTSAISTVQASITANPVPDD